MSAGIRPPDSTSSPTGNRTSHRIAVANFDAVEQTRTWLALGPAAANRTMLGALRTALLLAETVVLDRNQVLEGIFFITMKPDLLAWHLGLPPGSPLPLTIGLLNPGAGPVSTSPAGPWHTSDGPVWGVPEDVAEQIELNYLAVADDAVRVSSPLVAITGVYDGLPAGREHSVQSPRISRRWQEADPSFLPHDVWQLRDRTLAVSLIEEGRRAWVDAMKAGRVQVEPWRRAAIDIGGAFERSPMPEPPARKLADAILRLEEPGGQTAPCTASHSWLDDPVAGGPCTLAHATKRSIVVRWFAGEVVPELRPPQLDPALREEFSPTELEVAFRWWNAAYYDAICSRDELRMLTLHNVGVEDDVAEGSAEEPVVRTRARIELDWGLRKERPSRWATLRHRLSTRRRSRGPGDIAVEGEIVEHLVTFSPGQFAQLKHQEVIDAAELWRSPTNRRMFDLALAVRELAGDRTSRSTRLLINLVRVLALSALAVAFAVRDAGMLPVSGLVWVSVWALLAVVAAFPWAELAALLRMSGGQLQSTLRLRDEP